MSKINFLTLLVFFSEAYKEYGDEKKTCGYNFHLVFFFASDSSNNYHYYFHMCVRMFKIEQRSMSIICTL